MNIGVAISSLFDLFRKGSAVADPAKWKQHQITVTMLAPAILAVAHFTNSFGLNIAVDADTAGALATGIIAFTNVVLTITTTDKMGLLPAKSDGDNSQ